MELKQTFEGIEKSKEYLKWKEKNKGCYLSYVFIMQEKDKEGQWHFGFYNKSTDKTTTFILTSQIQVKEEEEIFKKPGAKVNQLDITKATLTFDEICKKAEEFCKKQYPHELINKKIVIFQNLDEFGDIWNITLVTLAFNTINLKIDPENGEVKRHNITSLMSFVEKK